MEPNRSNVVQLHDDDDRGVAFLKRRIAQEFLKPNHDDHAVARLMRLLDIALNGERANKRKA